MPPAAIERKQMPPAAIERKQLTLTDFQVSDDGPGTFAGYASVFNEVDSYGDTIAPGAYRDTLPKFLADGFVAWGHDTLAPVAYPTAAREDDRGLWIEAAFHTTAEAQAARQIILERAAAGKRSGLSIGYYARRSEMTAEGVRRLLDIDLVETSLVMHPADDHARVALVKAADTEPAPPCDCDPAAVVDYDTHAARLADHLEEFLSRFVQRTRSGSELRLKEGRAISTARRQRMASVSGSLREAADEIDAMLLETAPPEKAAPDAAPVVGYDARAQYLIVARRLRLLHGVAVEDPREPIAG
jgi:HK97 family phage prohead protease